MADGRYLKRMQALNQDGGERREDDGSARPGPGPGTMANQNAILQSALSAQRAQIIPRGRDAVDDWTPTLARTLAAHRQRTDADVAAQIGTAPLSLSFLSRKSPTSERFPSDIFQTSPGGERYGQHESYGTTNAPNPIDAVLPRSVLYSIIEVYFDYVYCLIPALHKPSFMADLHARREERPGEEEWTALVLSVIEATLVTMPRSFVRLSKRDIKELFQRAKSVVQNFLNQEFTVLTVTRTIIMYFHAVAHHHLGTVFSVDVLMGACYRLSIRLHLHDEASYRSLDPIERELRKRIFWLQYGADKTISAIDGAPGTWHEFDCGDVTLPSPIDDEYISEEGYGEQPEDRTPTLAGFYYISKLFRLLGQITDKRRIDRQRPPSGHLLRLRIQEVEQIFHQVMSLMDNAPEPLKLDLSSMGTPGARMELIDQHWDTHTSANIRQMVLDPSSAHREVVKDGVLVQQANIYVTQQMVRYIVMQYREELGVLLDQEVGQGNDHDRPKGYEAGRSLFSDEDKDQIASDLLMILSKIPLEVIAVNTVSLVIKIRYIASTLLDAMQSQSGGETSEARGGERAARAQGYLCELSIRRS